MNKRSELIIKVSSIKREIKNLIHIHNAEFSVGNGAIIYLTAAIEYILEYIFKKITFNNKNDKS